jgi:hypothetical protein
LTIAPIIKITIILSKGTMKNLNTKQYRLNPNNSKNIHNNQNDYDDYEDDWYDDDSDDYRNPDNRFKVKKFKDYKSQ